MVFEEHREWLEGIGVFMNERRIDFRFKFNKKTLISKKRLRKIRIARISYLPHIVFGLKITIKLKTVFAKVFTSFYPNISESDSLSHYIIKINGTCTKLMELREVQILSIIRTLLL